ncbi:cytochrome P450 [Actinomadura livida]|uniref:Cytochrome P450 n=1 Tax=Actinomadura livida TaxID=79909 RepID=A0A7W7MZG0_9ACTN|nr:MULTISPECIES: cytochrome P450 [Actinomadura]MBB4776916.1 cytochrome P450 [Actinomadura catellatispora]GGT95716.1 putative cytochrome P450 [Actinomadura livida]
MAPAAQIFYSPFDYAVHEDPYPCYARLRDEAPLYRNDELGFWALSRHADVSAAFRDHATFSNSHGVSLEPSAWGPQAHRTMSFLALDPPRHTRMRALVSKGFTPRRVKEMGDGIRALARRHLEPALEKREFDFVSDFAGLLPMDVISEMMGVPEADRVEVRRLADLVVHREEGLNDVPPAGMDAALTLVGYYQDMVAERRRRPADDLTSALLDAEIDGDRLDDTEVIAFLFLMVVAGNETTTKLLANALYWASLNPEQAAKPFGDPGRVDDWVEETLRYDTSSQMLARLVTTDIELHGQRVPAGDRMLLLVGSANRDPRVFEDADSYDLDRDTSQLVSFGGGRHFCLGANLARLEARIALGELVRRVSSFEVDHAGAERVHSVNVRGFAALPVRVVGRGRKES